MDSEVQQLGIVKDSRGGGTDSLCRENQNPALDKKMNELAKHTFCKNNRQAFFSFVRLELQLFAPDLQLGEQCEPSPRDG